MEAVAHSQGLDRGDERLGAEGSEGWSIVDASDLGSERSCTSDVPGHASAAGSEAAELADVADAQEQELGELVSNGYSSPKSETAADMVLGQPLAHSSTSHQPQPVPASDCLHLEGPLQEVVEAARRAQEAELQAQAASEEVQALVHLSNVSQEGGMEGFSDPATLQQQQQQHNQGQQQRHECAGSAEQRRQQHAVLAASSAFSAWFAAAGEVLGGIVGEVREEWGELTQLVKQALGTAQVQVEDVQGLASRQVKLYRQMVAKALHSPSPSWALLSLGAVSALAMLAIGTLVVANNRLAHQMKQRDRELARLVLRIVNLQQALQGSRAAVPILRHAASLQPVFAISSLA